MTSPNMLRKNTHQCHNNATNAPTRDHLPSRHYLVECPKGLDPRRPRRTQYMHFTLTTINTIYVNKDRVTLTLNFDRWCSLLLLLTSLSGFAALFAPTENIIPCSPASRQPKTYEWSCGEKRVVFRENSPCSQVSCFLPKRTLILGLCDDYFFISPRRGQNVCQVSSFTLFCSDHWTESNHETGMGNLAPEKCFSILFWSGPSECRACGGEAQAPGRDRGRWPEAIQTRGHRNLQMAPRGLFSVWAFSFWWFFFTRISSTTCSGIPLRKVGISVTNITQSRARQGFVFFLPQK